MDRLESAGRAEKKQTPHLVPFDSVIDTFTKDVAHVNEAPRSMRIDRTTLSVDGIRKIASAHDSVGGLEYYLYPDDEGLVFGSGSRAKAMPFDSNDEATFIKPAFPLSLFKSPKKDLEREQAMKNAISAIADGAVSARWFAHWHPWVAGEDPDMISIGDLKNTISIKGWHFKFNEHGVSMFAAAGCTMNDITEVNQALHHFENEYIKKSGESALKSVEYLKAQKSFLVERIIKQGFIYKEYSWDSGMARSIVEMMRGNGSL